MHVQWSICSASKQSSHPAERVGGFVGYTPARVQWFAEEKPGDDLRNICSYIGYYQLGSDYSKPAYLHSQGKPAERRRRKVMWLQGQRSPGSTDC
jgi:hypothetical protein